MFEYSNAKKEGVGNGRHLPVPIESISSLTSVHCWKL